MAAPAPQDRRVVKFTSPGLQADVRLKVFNVDFHVHSVLLKLHSSFFRKFLDSPDKEGTIPGSAEFKYEWVTKIDDDGSWHLVSAHTQTGKTNPTEKEKGKETWFFEIILRSIYREPYKIEFLSHLHAITSLADYYGTLRVVSNSVLANFFHCGFCRDIQRYSCSALPLALELRNRELFNEALILCLGPWHSPVYLDGLDGKLRDVADKAYNDLAKRILAPAEKAVTDYVVKVTMSGHVDNVRREMREHMGNVASKLLKTTGRLSLPSYYQELMNFESEAGGYPFKSLLGGLMDNHLNLNVDGQPGAGKYRDYFLCAWVDHKDLPWDINEVDW